MSRVLEDSRAIIHKRSVTVGIVVALFAITFLIGGSFDQKAYATEYTVSDEASCLALPGGSPSWDDTLNICNINDTLTIPAGDVLTISSDVILKINAILRNEGTINNSGIINIPHTIFNHGTLNNNAGAQLNVSDPSGSLGNDGTINNDGSFCTCGGILGNGHDNGPTATFNNNGVMHIFELVANRDVGIINNYAILNIGNGGFILNDGDIINYASSETDNEGTIENTFGQIFNKCGAIYNGNDPIGNPIIQELCDAIPPDTQITGAFDGKGVPLKSTPKKIATTTSTTAKFFFIGSDNQGIQKFQCSIDGGAWTDCTSGVTYNDLQAAITHVFSVKAIDLSGNEDPTPATFTWKINPPKLK